eukprot:6212839-Pleurochrysis_carterae.AAC.8
MATMYQSVLLGKERHEIRKLDEAASGKTNVHEREASVHASAPHLGCTMLTWPHRNHACSSCHAQSL